MAAEKSLRRLMFNISTLEELGEVLSSQNHFEDNLKIALYSLMGSLPVSRGALFLYRPRRRALVLEARRGLRLHGELRVPLLPETARALKRLRMPRSLARPTAGMAALLRAGEGIFDALQAAVIVPLKFKDQFIGIIALGSKFNGEEFSEQDFEFVHVMANYISIGIHNQGLVRNLETTNRELRKKVTENRRLYRNLEQIYNDTIRALGVAIDAKDPHTRGHSERVAVFSVVIAVRLGLPDEQVSAIRIASHLHDIGKIAIDNSILLKPSRLNRQEASQIQRHPMISYDILSNIKFPYPDVALIARHHHEWVNGAGYPDKLGVDELNPGMKIIALADAFDAMTSDRPYRAGMTLKAALEEIRRCCSEQFDPDVVDAFFGILGDEVRGEVDEPAIIPRLNSGFSPPEILRIVGGTC